VTGEGSRVELDFGNVLLTLAPSSDLILDAVDPQNAYVRLSAGTADVEVSEPLHDTLAFELPQGMIRISAAGSYHIELRANGDGRMIVDEGVAQISTAQAVFEQRSDEEVAIAHEGTFAIVPALARAAPHPAAAPRQPTPAGARSAEHVAPGLVGYRDLDEYGTWRWTPTYGMIWEPTRVARGWEPYRFGRWIWKSPWGWTWVDDAPWGFAPFHFGRWAYLRTRWVWVPGPRQVPTAYAPALVRWTREPADHEPVDAYPLAPEERYVPPYPASDLYKTRVNLFAVVSGACSHASADLDTSCGASSTPGRSARTN
jgi:hypothetical protein